jgi:NifB/MoaA-like Fe-S oxidoreductase
VTGLLTGQDIIAQMKDQDKGQAVLLPRNVLRAGENYLLDDVTLDDISRELDIPVRIIDSGGDDLLSLLFTDQP